MNKLTFLLVCIFWWISTLQAQDYSISGIITDSINLEPLSGATISFIQREDTTFKYHGITNHNGGFKILKVKSGNYRLEISFIGYQSLKRNTIVSNKDVNLGKIYLSPAISTLPVVQITGKEIAVKQKGDTTQFNAYSYKTNPDANAENLLEKMPGMLVENGTIQAQGEDVKQVLVDGKPFFGDDPNAALKNIPSEIIQKIQVFDQQSEQAQFTGFDDGNSIKTINIITKLEYRNGSFGKLYAGYGYEDKHSIGGVVNVFNGDQRISVLGQSNDINQQNFATEDLAGIMSSSNGGRGRRGGGMKGQRRPGGGNTSGENINDFLIGEQDGITSTNAFGINYTDKWGEKTDITSSYFFNQSNNTANILLSQSYFSSVNANQEYNEKEIAESENINHRFNLRLNYNINRNNSIVINPKLTLQANNGFSDLMGETILSDTILNSTLNYFKSDVSVWNFSNFLLWQHRFDKRGRSLSVTLSQDLKSNIGKSLLDARSNYYTTSQFDTIGQTADLNQFEQTYNARIVYTEPLGSKINLQFNYMPGLCINNSEKEAFNYNIIGDSYSIPDTTLSNVAESRYRTHEAGVGIRINKGKSMFMINSSYQLANLSNNQTLPFNSETNTTFTSFLPAAIWRYNISEKKNLRIFYRANTSAPSISQLQEVLDYSNPLQLSIGNAHLDQQHQHNLYAKYSSTNTDKNTIFFAMLSGSYINDFIGNNTTIVNVETVTPEGITLPPGSQLIRPQNLDGYYNLKGLVTYGMPVLKLKSNLNFHVMANFRRTPGIINNNLNLVNTSTMGIGAGLSSNISERVDFTVNSTSAINYTFNTLNANLNTQYFNQTSKLRLYWSFWENLTYRTELQHQFYTGFSEGFNTSYLLWNMSVGTRLFKNKKCELLVSIYDILNQNNSIDRISTETYVQDTETRVLNTYLMIKFKYNFTKFKSSG